MLARRLRKKNKKRRKKNPSTGPTENFHIQHKIHRSSLQKYHNTGGLVLESLLRHNLCSQSPAGKRLKESGEVKNKEEEKERRREGEKGKKRKRRRRKRNLLAEGTKRNLPGPHMTGNRVEASIPLKVLSHRPSQEGKGLQEDTKLRRRGLARPPESKRTR